MEKTTVRPDPEKMQYIINCMTAEELLCQLAEEASELAQKTDRWAERLDWGV